MVVRLTSGGSQMTVENYKGVSWTANGIKRYYDDPVDVDCVWFQDGVIKRATFNFSLLQKV